MRIVMMGTGPFAVPTLERLLQSPHEVRLVVARPPRAGRPHKGTRAVPTSPVVQLAELRQLPIFLPEDINADPSHQTLRGLDPDLLVVCDYGQILSSATLGIAHYGGINLHASLLPKYRGAAPVQWAIYHGESETGITVIHMTPLLDAGPALCQQRVTIGAAETAVDLEERLAILGAAAVIDAIDRLATWDGQTPIGEPQDPAQATRAPRLKKSHGQVDWSRSAQQIHDQVRALQGWPGTFTFWHRPHHPPLRLIVERVSVVDGASSSAPGAVVYACANEILVATGDGLLNLERLQPAGKRSMSVTEFQRGYSLSAGDRLLSTNES